MEKLIILHKIKNMNNRESPYRRWAIDRQNAIRSIFNIWKNKLHLKQEHLKLCILSPSKSVELRNCGWEALCNWNKGENLWKIIVPVHIKEVILIHELGHLYFPKEVNDMRLAPAKENEGLNTQIMKCLNSLEDCFVNFHLSKYEDYYKLWSNIMQTDLDDVINRENELYNIMAYYLLYYIEYNYV